MNNSTYNIVASTNQSTVVSEYTPDSRRADSYQSEAELEQEFIRLLSTLGYEYLNINSEKDLISNLRLQLERLNNFSFLDSEWDRLFNNYIASNNETFIDKTRKFQTNHIYALKLDDGTTRNIKLIDKSNIHNNKLQVINQYEETEGKHDTRYDVTILVNGLPIVHIELKRRGVPIREAFNQIERYKRDSFGASSGLYEYIQIFVISNGTNTKYYSNTTRDSHIKESSNKNRKSKKTSNSFEFTSFWADANNKIITDLVDFTRTFFAKHSLLNILTKYCVFTSEDILLVMRPYQISACERIINRIEVAHNYKKYGTVEGGGYIWHTTGSGKTLTSFKTAQLACNLPYIDKVLFVVDRKDLDYQTMKEYDRFEKGAANSNTSTSILQRQLESDDSRIIITTIQKLGVFISKNKGHEVFKKHVVIIFDECHRSQFGEMHTSITKNFKSYHIFGFTGTPIFSVNSSSGGNINLKTTPQAFGEKLHTYTIVDAINDGNVLPFRIDYVNTVKEKEGVKDSQVRAIDIEKAMASPQRISNIVSYILEHFNQKTKRNEQAYSFSQLQNIEEVASARNRGTVEEIKQKTRLTGFNSMFAVASIDTAKAYYNEFKKQMLEKPGQALRVGIIYSFGVNEDVDYDILEEENPEDTSGLDQSSRDFLDMAIKDYNEMFATNYDTSSDKFQNYYKDVSLRMKNRELDLLIVVNMFLTGFDATTLNTLWVDKNLKYHGLIQAFSRTNRILNSVKTYGNIVCFRDLQTATEEAIALFGDKEASGIVLLKNYEDYYYGYDDEKGHHAGYEELIAQLKEKFPICETIQGEENQKEFIKLYGAILRIRNILSAFDNFADDKAITERDLQDYQSKYVDLYQELRGKDKADKENINNDIEFEMELIRQVEVNIDYILLLVIKYHKTNCTDKEILADINRAICSSPQLRSKKELIENFIAAINTSTKVDEDWKKFVVEQKEADLKQIIDDEKLKPEETKKFIDNSFRDGVIKTSGTDLDRLLPPMGLFGDAGKKRQAKKQTIIEKLSKFFEKYLGL
ncbi:MAG: DEAD/DEAH box helicase [Candidatus Melainabacteria bacterium LEY3_CP_29_8]|nr:MAG: DEAD/DEAH box helicase [Candidatus Melainabacteria bacterium LEY3_CP_29_8]